MTVDELYDQSIKHYSAGERLQLAKRILNELPATALADFSCEWSEEDVRDISNYSSQLAQSIMVDE